VADLLEQYLTRVLGVPSERGGLYRHIRSVSVGLHVAAVHTDLSSDDVGRQAADQTALDVEVYGQAGDLIAVYDDTRTLAATTGRLWLRQIRPPAGAGPSPVPRRPTLDRGRESPS
jgi:hypothetical protein